METRDPDGSHLVFEVTDPTGRRIILERDRWERHIAARRPELARHPGWINDALCDPSFIYDSATNEDDRHYYLRLRKEAEGGLLFVKVVVRFDERLVGRVITAHLASKVVSRRLLWISPKALF